MRSGLSEALTSAVLDAEAGGGGGEGWWGGGGVQLSTVAVADVK